MQSIEVDHIVMGAGMYGLYAARYLLRKGKTVALIEVDGAPFQRASYINQARIHNGYHYPRSFSTAIKSAHYFERFNREFAVAVNDSFRKIYAVSSRYSLTSAEQFEKFCRMAEIRCRPITPDEYFDPDMVEGVFETTEYAYDAQTIRDFLVAGIEEHRDRMTWLFGRRVVGVEQNGDRYQLALDNGSVCLAPAVLNATYGSVNQVNQLFGFETFAIKYEICEIILGRASANIADVGITVMDGPFFSMMPFGKTGLHSLTSVSFTPHRTCHSNLPRFSCQERNAACTPQALANCQECSARPPSAWPYMSQLARKYLRSDIHYSFEKSLFSMKPILSSSELDDSRPTLVRVLSEHPRFVSVLSGKINTVYDLEEVL